MNLIRIEWLRQIWEFVRWQTEIWTTLLHQKDQFLERIFTTLEYSWVFRINAGDYDTLEQEALSLFIFSEPLDVSLKIQKSFTIQIDSQNQLSVIHKIDNRVKIGVSVASSSKSKS